MKKNNRKDNSIKLTYLTAVLFLAFIAAAFALNMKEVVQGIIETGNLSLRKIAAECESVEAITYPFVNLNGLYQSILQRDYMYDADPSNDAIRNSDCYLVSAGTEYSEKKLRKSADTLAATSKQLAKKDIPTLLVQAPGKLSGTDENPLPGIENLSDDKVNSWLSYLEKRRINSIDTREWIADEGISAFYRSDHHWTTETAFKVAGSLTQYMNDRFGLDLDVSLLDESNFEFSRYENCFLGSEGRRTGRYYVGLDDFTVIEPKFKTDFELTISDKDGKHFERSGSFRESIMDTSINVEKYSFDDSAYYVYWGGDYGRVHVENKTCRNGKSAVIFKDSFGIPVTAFLTNVFSSVDIIDMRYYSEDKTVADLIDEADPDIVMYIYGPGYLTKKKMFGIS